MAGLIDDVYRTHGRLDGVIHGAGIIEDKLVEEKTPESFDRVFDTKVRSAFLLSRLLRPEGCDWSLVQSLHPADFTDAHFDATGSMARLEFTLFTDGLEKGVIRRARLRTTLVPRQADVDIASSHVEHFCASPPPLTT